MAIPGGSGSASQRITLTKNLLESFLFILFYFQSLTIMNQPVKQSKTKEIAFYVKKKNKLCPTIGSRSRSCQKGGESALVIYKREQFIHYGTGGTTINMDLA